MKETKIVTNVQDVDDPWTMRMADIDIVDTFEDDKYEDCDWTPEAI